MPRLKSIRYENFAQRIALGYPAEVAYRLSGFPFRADNNSAARRLQMEQRINTRIQELRHLNDIISKAHDIELAEIVERFDADITIEEYRRQLLVNLKMARDAGKFKEANDALLMLGRTKGFINDLPQVNGKAMSKRPVISKPGEQRRRDSEEADEQRKERVRETKDRTASLQEVDSILGEFDGDD